MKKLFALVALVSLAHTAYAGVVMSSTRESPNVEPVMGWSVGAGYTSTPEPFRGDALRDETDSGAPFVLGRFGLLDGVEAQVAGLLAPFFTSSAEIRVKARWLHTESWSIATSGFYFTESLSGEGSEQSYDDHGLGTSTAVGYAFTPALTGYIGG